MKYNYNPSVSRCCIHYCKNIVLYTETWSCWFFFFFFFPFTPILVVWSCQWSHHTSSPLLHWPKSAKAIMLFFLCRLERSANIFHMFELTDEFIWLELSWNFHPLGYVCYSRDLCWLLMVEQPFTFTHFGTPCWILFGLFYSLKACFCGPALACTALACCLWWSWSCLQSGSVHCGLAWVSCSVCVLCIDLALM